MFVLNHSQVVRITACQCHYTADEIWGYVIKDVRLKAPNESLRGHFDLILTPPAVLFPTEQRQHCPYVCEVIVYAISIWREKKENPVCHALWSENDRVGRGKWDGARPPWEGTRWCTCMPSQSTIVSIASQRNVIGSYHECTNARSAQTAKAKTLYFTDPWVVESYYCPHQESSYFPPTSLAWEFHNQTYEPIFPVNACSCKDISLKFKHSLYFSKTWNLGYW